VGRDTVTKKGERWKVIKLPSRQGKRTGVGRATRGMAIFRAAPKFFGGTQKAQGGGKGN